MRARLPRTNAALNMVAATAAAVALIAQGPIAAAQSPGLAASATTPIQHLVVIFQENVSFDHYFGTYPTAANTSGQKFVKRGGTPTDVTGLTKDLLTKNPNGTNPRRYDPSNINDVLTCDQDHNYHEEQVAFDGGKMDQFPSSTGTASGNSPTGQACAAGDVMNYYDGNTVTALWNYAQQYAMNDNSFSPTFGPSSPGAINLVSGDTGGVDTAHEVNSPTIATTDQPDADLQADGQGGYSLIGDAQPYWDDCSTRDAVAMTGQNIGDQLNAAGLSWGWFQGGFRPTTSFSDATTAIGRHGQPTRTFVPNEFKSAGFEVGVPHSSKQGICNAVTPVGVAVGGYGQYGYKDDYIPHHEPFEYYASTANPHHLSVQTDAQGRDTIGGLATIGHDTQTVTDGVPQFDTPNHQYDTSDWNQLVAAINAHQLPPSALPAVSFLKAPGFQDGHAAYSDPFDEQVFLANTINALMAGPDWPSTAIVIAYDDSDGWYDHVYSGVTNPSSGAADALTGAGECGSGTPLASQDGRCGLGPRQPFLVISPWAKSNFIDHTRTDLSSIVKFIQDDWGLPPIDGSSASQAGALAAMFDFKKSTPQNGAKFLLSPVTGRPS